MSERETVVELPFAADCCPWVEKLRTVSPLPVGIRDGVVHLVSTLGSGWGEGDETGSHLQDMNGLERGAYGAVRQLESGHVLT
jgi:hypothetical protein